MELLIMADDLTGSLDSGVQLAKAGFSTLVVYDLSPEVLEEHPDIQVLVVDTETRHESARSAYRKIYDLARRVRAAGIRRVYKKHDSTLRGNIGSELAAVMDGMESDRMFFAPAYPRLSRLTVGGVQYVDGVPLMKTVFAADPFNPVSSSSVAEVIAQQTAIPVVNVSPEQLTGAVDDLPDRAIVVVDAQNDSDLLDIARSQAGHDEILLGGSSGLSAPLPDILGMRASPLDVPLSPQRVLVICGSLNICSIQQVQCAAEQGAPLFALAPEQKRGEYAHSADRNRFCEEVAAALKQSGCAILQTCADAVDIEPTESLEIAGCIGRLAGEILQRGRPEMVVVFGGDTLLGVVQSLHGAMLMPQCEAFPGVVQSRLTWADGSMALVSKAGGFGGPQLLVDLLRYYRIWT